MWLTEQAIDRWPDQSVNQSYVGNSFHVINVKYWYANLQWFGKIWGCSALAKPLTEPTDDLFSELFWDAEIFRKSK